MVHSNGRNGIVVFADGNNSPRRHAAVPSPTRPVGRRLMLVAWSVVLAELAAWALLKAGYSNTVSLGCTAVAGLCFVAWPAIVIVTRALGAAGQKAAAPLGRRETYRFRLSTLLALVFVLSCVLAWHRYRLRRFDLEYAALGGKWRLLNEMGEPLVINGEPLMMEFNRNECSLVDVSSEIRSIGFRTPAGTCEAIYQWEGKRLRLRESSAGLCRPSSFDKDDFPTTRPGSPPGRYSCSCWIVERSPVD